MKSLKYENVGNGMMIPKCKKNNVHLLRASRSFGKCRKLSKIFYSMVKQRFVCFRQASDGIWLITLVPCALMCGTKYVDRISSTYSTVSLIGVGLLVSSVCTLHSGVKLRLKDLITNCVLASTVTSVLLAFIQNYGKIGQRIEN